MWELDHEEGWVLKNLCFWIVVLEKTLESRLDCKETKPVNPKGNQLWIFLGRIDTEAEAPILWPCDAKSWLIREDPDAWKDWGQEEKEATEDKMVGWHQWWHQSQWVWVELSKLPEIVVAVHGVTKSWTQLSDWTTTIGFFKSSCSVSSECYYYCPYQILLFIYLYLLLAGFLRTKIAFC